MSTTKLPSLEELSNYYWKRTRKLVRDLRRIHSMASMGASSRAIMGEIERMISEGTL